MEQKKLGEGCFAFSQFLSKIYVRLPVMTGSSVQSQPEISETS
nr:hypothetical protein [uncultured Anaerostipes sp.]